MPPNRPLDKAERERRRLERAERSRQNRRGRVNPAPVPAKLTRTSAFAPKRHGLITDANFQRLYVVPNHSAVFVSGRELGSQHRDALYATFRIKPKLIRISPEEAPAEAPETLHRLCEARTTWRSLLSAMGRSEHVNNLLTLMNTFKELKQVVITVQEGDPETILSQYKKGLLAGPGIMDNILQNIEWEGADLDSAVTIRYGIWVRQMFEKTRLVSLNADVQFKLSSDHAKTFWPYIDSHPNNSFVDEDVLAALCGRDLWGDAETSASRAQFRKDCRQAFDDMVACHGLGTWTEEVRGKGRRKTRRYHYTHYLPRQMELDLLPDGEQAVDFLS